MVSCFLRYVLDPLQLREFERYARRWIALTEKHGGRHHGYYLPSEGANNIALALFSFDSLAAYERFRLASREDEQCRAAVRHARETGCILSYERSFFRPVFEGEPPTAAPGPGE